MKWIFATLALLAIVFAGIWLFAEAPKDTAIDPDRPWLHKAAEAVEETQKDEAKADPRKIEDVILQKDYCAAGQYFNRGRNQKHVMHFLDIMFEGEAGKAIAPDDKLILQALLSKDFDYAVKKLKEARNWQGKMILGMVLSGTIDFGQSFARHEASKEELQEALLALDQAEDLNWDNGWIPVYRYLVMKRKDGEGPGLTQFLKDELSRRQKMENPFQSSKVAFGRLRAQDPVMFAASLPLALLPLQGNVTEGMRAIEMGAKGDPEIAKSSLRLAEALNRSTIPLVNEGFSEPMVGAIYAGDSIGLGAKLWKIVNPTQPLPERFRETPSDLTNRMGDRNPSETWSYGWINGYRKECSPKWKEAVDNDYALLRDRLQKWDELQRAAKR